MHNKEWGRPSNTGKLLKCGLPEQSHLYLYGRKKDEYGLVNTLLKHPSIVLYPSSNSEPISTYANWYLEQDEVNICVIDSTWSQSKSMNKIIPSHIPRVHVDDCGTGQSGFLNRKQSIVPGRVSTIEAVMYALQALGEPPEISEPFNKALHLSVDTVLHRRGRKPAYGTDFAAKLAAAPLEDPNVQARVTITRPTHCPICQANSDVTSFKNFGVRGPDSADKSVCDGWDSGSSSGSSESNRISIPKKYRVWKCKACQQHFKVELSN